MEVIMAKKIKRPKIIELTIAGNCNEINNLLETDNNINEQDSDGWTALHYAAQSGNISIGKALLENKAQVDIKDSYGNTPLLRAVFNFKGNGDMIKLLLKYGADKNLKNSNGMSALSLAQTIANFPVAQFLK
jgi:ankyrin repeat protein